MANHSLFFILPTIEVYFSGGNETDICKILKFQASNIMTLLVTTRLIPVLRIQPSFFDFRLRQKKIMPYRKML